jgi:hypothetical protein
LYGRVLAKEEYSSCSVLNSDRRPPYNNVNAN